MIKQVKGNQVFLDGEAFYKIQNYDCMDDFFMTITSSSDVWNFLWAQGGITAGRKNCDFSIFPYYTCDKIQDTKSSTGSVTIVKVKNEGKKGIIWQPFENLFSTGTERYSESINIQRNLYKNLNGSKIWFEEINLELGLLFRYGWTSSSKYGLVKTSHIENLTERKITVEVLDGARNIMCSSSDAKIQNDKSVLLDAYKKCEVLEDSNMAIFSLSSVLTDRAEPSESLFTNVSWFSSHDPIILSENAIPYFLSNKTDLLYAGKKEMNGKRPQCYIIHKAELLGKSAECWEQIFDVDYDVTKLIQLESEIKNREDAVKLLIKDIADTEAKLEENIKAADGIQSTKNEISDLHHRTNVMFNIMRGGLFCNSGKINIKDFIDFAKIRNVKKTAELESVLKTAGYDSDDIVAYGQLKSAIYEKNDDLLKRLFREYLPLTFSRRHGDPSRPWNRFNIEILDENGNDKINYEGNWRDIFQNWESLLWSYPEYAENVCSVFLNTMTVEGYNPYRISRNGLDWEVPEEGNPWAQYGYWGDHQVIYLQKFLEFLAKLDKKALLNMMNEKSFTTGHLPYIIKSYAEIYKDPRNSIIFDYDMDAKLRNLEKTYGTDARLVLNKDESVQLTTMITKVLQIVLAKTLNHIPGAGIWMNTQRPEWNDANNALAGFGTSVVTMCYLHRMLSFLVNLVETSGTDFSVNKTVADTLKKAAAIYADLNAKDSVSDAERKSFTDKFGTLFEAERTKLYADGFADGEEKVSATELADMLKTLEKGIKNSIEANRREDGLFHSYNSVRLLDSEIQIVNLKLMLEGQVAVLSCNVPSKNEKKNITAKLRKSDLFEEHQYSYMLYPNSKLPAFKNKNNISENEISGLEKLIEKTGNTILRQDKNGNYHFNPFFRNADTMKEYLAKLPAEKKANAAEEKLLEELYEKKFNHQSFTGRSGTFYCYEGLGCIYWHMVSKLLLAVQENIEENKDDFFAFYKDVKKGLGSAKTPSEYGAFPYDPYSHTPYLQGARQPGMTGQVKEEILTRFGELGLKISDGKAYFDPIFLDKSDFHNGKLSFTWCGTKIVYDTKKDVSVTIEYEDGKKDSFKANCLPEKESKLLFSRSDEIKEIIVGLKK